MGQVKLISISLYGDKPMYRLGAVENVRLLPEIYPGWKMRIFHDEGLDVRELRHSGVELVPMPKSRDQAGMFWRFLPAWEPLASHVIFRDADSRLNVKEAAAVKAWIDSGAAAHCMHDHKHHSRKPILGGMWGIRTGVLPREIYHKVRRKGRQRLGRVVDMVFLQREVHPIIQQSVVRHSSVKVKWPFEPFPAHPEFEGFVGQQFDENGNAICP